MRSLARGSRSSSTSSPYFQTNECPESYAEAFQLFSEAGLRSCEICSLMYFTSTGFHSRHVSRITFHALRNTRRRSRDEARNVRRNLFAFFFLKKMPRTLDHYFRFVLRRRNQLSKEAIAAARNRIAVGEHNQRRLGPVLQRFASFAHVGRAWLIGVDGDESRKHLRAGFVSGIRERRVVSRNDLIGDRFAIHHASPHDRPARQVRCAHRISPPLHEALGRRHVARRKACVHDDESCESVGNLRNDSQAKYSAPVLNDGGDSSQLQCFDEACDRAAMHLEGVLDRIRELIRAAKSDE